MLKKISELELYKIDFLVAKAQGLDAHITNELVFVKNGNKNDCFPNDYYSPTTNPSQAWPIIEREKIGTWVCTCGVNQGLWKAMIDEPIECVQYGKTSLEAAMRCFLVSIYGEEV